MSTSSPRKRTRKTTKIPSSEPAKQHTTATESRASSKPPRSFPISISDTLRLLSTLLALTFSLSYYLTSGDSLTFHTRLPRFLRPSHLSSYFRGPLLLTPQELSLYNGTAYPTLPILLAINGTIFDVSASPHTYGPGGSYSVFAGRDATRAFVTGCFEDDLNADLRGVERMYVPVEDVGEEEEGGEGLTSGERKVRREVEWREARKRVRQDVERWVAFYRGHQKYLEVGRVVGGEGEKGVVPELCESAEMARPKRSQIIAEAKANVGEKGKPVFRPKKGEGGKGKPV